jgi:hypothetical protein
VAVSQCAIPRRSWVDPSHSCNQMGPVGCQRSHWGERKRGEGGRGREERREREREERERGREEDQGKKKIRIHHVLLQQQWPQSPLKCGTRGESKRQNCHRQIRKSAPSAWKREIQKSAPSVWFESDGGSEQTTLRLTLG